MASTIIYFLLLLTVIIIHILTGIYNSADIQACYLAKKVIIVLYWIASEIHNEMSSLLVVVKSHLFPQFVHLH